MTATSEPGRYDDWADTGPIPLAPATGDANKAREARYAAAIISERYSEPTASKPDLETLGAWMDEARAVMAVADAEVEAATRDLRAEVERLRHWDDTGRALFEDAARARDAAREEVIRLRYERDMEKGRADAGWARAERAEAERDQLWAVAEGRILHRFMGNCPDSLDGFDLRDPDCPACAALVQVGAADTQPEGHVLAMNAGQAWTCACGRAGIKPQTPEGRGLTHAQHLREVAVRCVCGHLRRGEHYTDSISDVVMCAVCECREFTPTAGSKVATAPEADGDCPHAAPFRYCDGCKVDPCPIGLGGAS